MKKTVAALIFADNMHYLDHMAPLCSILDVVLFVTEPAIYECGQKYYPNLKIEKLSLSNCTATLTKTFDCILTNLPQQMFDALFHFDERVCQKKLLNIWVPHGNSDKGIDEYLGHVLKEEKIILYYGQKFFNEIIEHEFNPRRAVLIGNYRLEYFNEHKDFYQKELDLYLKDTKKKKILFAPTWEHKTLQDCIEPLIKGLDDETTLLVKPHPNTIEKGILWLEKIACKHKSVKLLLGSFPIYPLLSQIEALITDYSSIGHDFLNFNKALILINAKNSQTKDGLHHLGPSLFIKNAALAYSQLKESDSYSQKRKKALEANFTAVSFSDVKKQLLQAIDYYYSQEVHTL